MYRILRKTIVANNKFECVTELDVRFRMVNLMCRRKSSRLFCVCNERLVRDCTFNESHKQTEFSFTECTPHTEWLKHVHAVIISRVCEKECENALLYQRSMICVHSAAMDKMRWFFFRFYSKFICHTFSIKYKELNSF